MTLQFHIIFPNFSIWQLKLLTWVATISSAWVNLYHVNIRPDQFNTRSWGSPWKMSVSWNCRVFIVQIMRPSISVRDTKRELRDVQLTSQMITNPCSWILNDFNNFLFKFSLLIVDTYSSHSQTKKILHHDFTTHKIFLEKLDFDFDCYCYEFLTQDSAQLTQLHSWVHGPDSQFYDAIQNSKIKTFSLSNWLK